MMIIIIMEIWSIIGTWAIIGLLVLLPLPLYHHHQVRSVENIMKVITIIIILRQASSSSSTRS